jgi:hypothetical protein
LLALISSNIGCWLQIKEKITYLALLETLDSGKPKDEAVADMVFLIIHIIMFSVPKDAPYLYLMLFLLILGGCCCMF